MEIALTDWEIMDWDDTYIFVWRNDKDGWTSFNRNTIGVNKQLKLVEVDERAYNLFDNPHPKVTELHNLMWVL